MDETPVVETDAQLAPETTPAPRWPTEGDFGPKSWIPYCLPFLVYMIVGSFEPPQPDPSVLKLSPEEQKFWEEGQEHTMVSLMGIHYSDYPKIYSLKIGLTILSMLLVLPGYRKFPFRVSWLAIAVGAVGVVLWIALCHPWVNANILTPVGLMSLEDLGERPAFNPFVQLKDNPAWAYTFLAIRFLGLALIVPIIEEFFLRGFLMRFVMDADWWEIPFGHCNILALIVGTAVPMMMHPGELLSSLVWFTLVTWLMLRTRNIWDCVAAHVVTNLLLGIYVVAFSQWYLW